MGGLKMDAVARIMGQDEGVNVGQCPTLDFTGTGVTVTKTGDVLSISVPGGGGGVSALTDLNDVTIATAAEGQVLRKGAGTSDWVNQQLAHADLSSIGANDHHNQSHALTSTADHTGTVTDAQHGTRTLIAAHAHGSLSGVGANDHHAQAHSLDSIADHSGTITDAQHGTRALAAAHAHGSLSGIAANDHHAQAHTIDGGDHSGTITDAQHGTRALVAAHAHGSLSSIAADDHHNQSHTHGAVADGTLLAPGTMRVPNGNPTLGTLGEIGVDGTLLVFKYHDGTGVRNVSPVRQAVIFVENPTGTDDFPVLRMRAAGTFLEVDYLCIGGTSWIGQLMEADINGTNEGTTQAADSTAIAGTNLQVTSFANGSFDAGDYIRLLTTTVNGTPTQVVINAYWREGA